MIARNKSKLKLLEVTLKQGANGLVLLDSTALLSYLTVTFYSCPILINYEIMK